MVLGRTEQCLGNTQAAAAAAKSLQSCPILCDSRDGSLPFCPWDSPCKNTGVGCHVLLQCMEVKSESEIAQLCPTLRDPMVQAPPSTGFSRQEYWSGVPLPSPSDLLGGLKHLFPSLPSMPETDCSQLSPLLGLALG